MPARRWCPAEIPSMGCAAITATGRWTSPVAAARSATTAVATTGSATATTAATLRLGRHGCNGQAQGRGERGHCPYASHHLSLLSGLTRPAGDPMTRAGIKRQIFHPTPTHGQYAGRKQPETIWRRWPTWPGAARCNQSARVSVRGRTPQDRTERRCSTPLPACDRRYPMSACLASRAPLLSACHRSTRTGD